MAAGQGPSCYLGFDFSTQQIKVIAIDDNLNVIHESAVKFDTDLPHYKTQGGVHIHTDNVTITAPPVMWVEALDLLLDRMKASGFDFSKVVALSGAGQQHGSVYWNGCARETLNNLQPGTSLHTQLKDSFTRESPIWMDASTTRQCRTMEDSVGGAMKLAEITGSKGYERFTGNQIMKVRQNEPDIYTNTERISLVSSFAACLFLGDFAPIDYSDGSGMNLLDIRSREWSEKCLQACGNNLEEKLGHACPSSQQLGGVSSYFVERYSFCTDCQVVAFTGDNPASLAGMAPCEGDIVVSLGTSDSVFLWLTEPTPGLDGHIFVNPVNSSQYMGLTCFKNGSLTRENVKDEYAGGSWDTFAKHLADTPLGNSGNIGIYFDVTEIQPVACGRFRFSASDKELSSFPASTEVRAVIESQMMSRRVHSENLGMKFGKGTRVLATGGASINTSILQVMADVFNAPVFVTDVPNSAALGSCYRAKHGLFEGNIPFSDIVKNHPEPVCVARPVEAAEKIYDALCDRYRALENQIADGTHH